MAHSTTEGCSYKTAVGGAMDNTGSGSIELQAHAAALGEAIRDGKAVPAGRPSACPNCPATTTGSTWPARPPLQVSLRRPSPAGWPAAAPSATLSLSRVGSSTGCTGEGQRSRHGRTKKRPRQLGGRRPAQAASWDGRCVDQHARVHSTRFSIRSSHPISGQQPVLCTDLCTRRHETGTNRGDPVRSQRRRQGVCAALSALRSRSATAETGVVVLITQRRPSPP